MKNSNKAVKETTKVAVTKKVTKAVNETKATKAVNEINEMFAEINIEKSKIDEAFVKIDNKINIEKSKVDLTKPELEIESKPELEIESKPEPEIEIEIEKEPEMELESSSNLSEFEKALNEIESHVQINENLKIRKQDNASGNSFFSGKDRLCKLLKTKRGISLEINVQLPKELQDLPGMEHISIAVAHAKHLGTMKHHYRSSDSNSVKTIINAIIEIFKTKTTTVSVPTTKTESKITATKTIVTKNEIVTKNVNEESAPKIRIAI